VKRRILLLLTDLKIGGTPTVVRELALRLSREPDVEIHVASLDHPGPVSQELTDHGIPVSSLNAKGPFDLSVICRLHQLISRHHFDTVFSFLIHANAAATLASLFSGNIRFLQSIQTTQPNPRWHWLVQSIIQHAAEKIVVPSPSVAAIAKTWADVPADKIQIIPNAIDLNEFNIPPSPHRNRIGFIGRLDPIKRIGDLIHAMPLLSPEITLHIFGEGSERSQIESLIHSLNLKDRITLHGPVPHPRDALSQIDLLVLPSAAEGFGLVLIEAMAAGIPLIATNVPGIRDIVFHEKNGLLVNRGDIHALAVSIEKLQHDLQLRKNLIAGGKLTVTGRFTWEMVYPLYRSLLKLDH
jgi:glycosyltransferase involved in cell wall biosynthesis